MDGGAQQSLIDSAKANGIRLRAALSKPTDMHLYFCGDGKDDAQRWRRVRLSAPLSKDLLNAIIRRLSELAQGKQMVEYTFDEMVPSVIGVWRKSEIKEIGDWLACVPPSDWPHLFDGSPAFTSGIRYQRIVSILGYWPGVITRFP